MDVLRGLFCNRLSAIVIGAAILSVWLAGASACADMTDEGVPPVKPPAEGPQPTEPEISSEELSRSGGVIEPPPVDPEMVEPPPETGAQTPVIKPPEPPGEPPTLDPQE